MVSAFKNVFTYRVKISQSNRVPPSCSSPAGITSTSELKVILRKQQNRPSADPIRKSSHSKILALILSTMVFGAHRQSDKGRSVFAPVNGSRYV